MIDNISTNLSIFIKVQRIYKSLWSADEKWYEMFKIFFYEK